MGIHASSAEDTDRSSVPGGAGAAEGGGADHGGAVHLPDRDVPAVVLPQNVGIAVAVEIA